MKNRIKIELSTELRFLAIFSARLLSNVDDMKLWTHTYNMYHDNCWHKMRRGYKHTFHGHFPISANPS